MLVTAAPYVIRKFFLALYFHGGKNVGTFLSVIKNVYKETKIHYNFACLATVLKTLVKVNDSEPLSVKAFKLKKYSKRWFLTWKNDLKHQTGRKRYEEKSSEKKKEERRRDEREDEKPMGECIKCVKGG